MRQSAEYFLTGFFGFDWQVNPAVKLEFILELSTDALYNDSLAGYGACPNNGEAPSDTGSTASLEWANIYLQNATSRLNALAGGFNWTVSSSLYAQELCAYETVALGYSQFCSLFTYQEWQGFEYSLDLSFAGNNMFQSPTGRAVGIGWVQELLGVCLDGNNRLSQYH